MRKEIFLLIGVLFLVVIGFLGPDRTMEALTKVRGVLLSGVTVSLPVTTLEEENIEITLPDTTEPVVEQEDWEAVGIGEEEEQEPVIEGPKVDGEEPVIIAPKEETKMTLAEIREQVDGISERVEVISGKVAKLVEIKQGLAQAEPELELEKEAHLAEIRAKIQEITAQIEELSAKAAELPTA